MIIDDFLDSDHIILESRVYRLWLENRERMRQSPFISL